MTPMNSNWVVSFVSASPPSECTNTDLTKAINDSGVYLPVSSASETALDALTNLSLALPDREKGLLAQISPLNPLLHPQKSSQ